MYSYSRQNFSYLGNRLAATHKGCSQKISPALVYRSVGKMIEAPETEEQLSKERCGSVSLPISQPSAFPGCGAFPVGVVNAASPFPVLLEDFSPKVAMWAHIKGNSLMASNYQFPAGPSSLRSAATALWKIPHFGQKSQAGCQLWNGVPVRCKIHLR